MEGREGKGGNGPREDGSTVRMTRLFKPLYCHVVGYELNVLLCLLPTTSSSGDQPLMLNQPSVYCCRSSLSVAETVMREEGVVPSSTVTLEMETGAGMPVNGREM